VFTSALVQEGVLHLRVPPTRAALLRPVRCYFRAVAAKSPELLQTCVAEGAQLSSQADQQSLLGSWISRFARLPYEALPYEQVFDIREVELDAGTHHDAQGSVEARVRPKMRDVAGQQLYSEQIVFSLRRDGSRYVIASVTER
jgi:hypothetical protein